MIRNITSARNADLPIRKRNGHRNARTGAEGTTAVTLK